MPQISCTFDLGLRCRGSHKEYFRVEGVSTNQPRSIDYPWRMTLQHFEEYISDTIVQRGWSYYVNDHVAPPQKWTDTRYEFLVTGTEPYQVRIERMQNQILETSCTCPYDQEVICKHVAAALFYLRETPTSPGHTEQPPARVKLQELLQQVSKDQLQTFILNKAERDTLFREEFLMTFARVSAKNAKAHYRQHLRQLLERAAGPGGFVDWYHARDLSEGVDVILAQAQTAIETGNGELALSIGSAVMEEMIDALQIADDSHGYISDCIDEGLALIKTLASTTLADRVRRLLFQYCLSTVENKHFESWEWHWELLRLAVQLTVTDQEAARVKVQTEKDYASTYDRQTAQEIHYHLLTRLGQTAAAQSYLLSHRHNPTLRRLAIRTFLETGKYEQAQAMAEEGIRQDNEQHHRLTMEWYDWLLQVAVAKNEQKEVIRLARILFFWHSRFDDKYYQILKQYVPDRQWPSFVEQVIQEMNALGYVPADPLAKVFIQEEQWLRLLAFLQSWNDLVMITRYEKYLPDEYANTIVMMYRKAILQYMADHTGRDHYRQVVQHLQRMLALGGYTQVAEVIEVLTQKYPRRTALREELGRLQMD